MPSEHEKTLKETSLTECLYLEDLRVGASWTSHSREVSADDVSDFAVLTGDHDPLHTDQGYDSPFGQPIAHGLFGLSLLAGMSTEHPRVATRALVALSDWSFDGPVFFGDSVTVRTEVVLLEPYGRRCGRVTWRRELINQDGRIVQQGQFISLVAARQPIKKAKPSGPAPSDPAVSDPLTSRPISAR